MIKLQDLKLDSTRKYMVDVHGKKYPIKQQRGRYYIQHSGGQLTVTSLVKMEVKEIDYVVDYFSKFMQFPCPAMDFWIIRHRLKKNVNYQSFKVEYAHTFKFFKPVFNASISR